MKREFLLIDVLCLTSKGNFNSGSKNTDQIVKFMLDRKDFINYDYEKICEICRCYLIKKMPWLEGKNFCKMSPPEKYDWYIEYIKNNGEFVEIETLNPLVQKLILRDAHNF